MVRPCGRVFRAEEGGEGLVGRNDIGVDGVGDLLGQALLVFEGDACGIFLCREEKGIGVDDALTLDGKLLQQESDGHELVFHAGAKHFGGLAEDARNLVKTGDVVLVMLDRVEGNGQRQIREAGMDAILLVDWHLVLFQVEVGDALLEDTNQKVVGELVLVGEARSRDGLEPGKEVLVDLVALGDGVERVLGELVVVAVVAESGGALGKVAEIGLVLLFEKGVLGGEAVGNWFEVLGEDGTRYDD